MSFRQLDRLAIEAGFAPANDNPKPTEDDDDLSWSPPRQKQPPRDGELRRSGDGGPDPARLAYMVQRRLLSDANTDEEPRSADNDNWPLLKVLRRSALVHCERLAHRYRSVFDRAHAPIELTGQDIEADMRLVHRMDLDEASGNLVDKGVKRVVGRRHPIPETNPSQALRSNPDQPMGRARSVVQRWNGDLPLVDRIDCRTELAGLRHELGHLTETFEAAVCDGDTLEEIGSRHGAGKSTAGAVGRAFVMLGFEAVDAFWRLPRGKLAPHGVSVNSPVIPMAG